MTTKTTKKQSRFPTLSPRHRRLLAYVGLAFVMVLGFLDDQRDDEQFRKITQSQQYETEVRIYDDCVKGNEDNEAIKGTFDDLIKLATGDVEIREGESVAEFEQRKVRLQLFIDQFAESVDKRLPKQDCPTEPVKPE